MALLIVVPIASYFFWKVDGFNTVLRWFGITPTAGASAAAAAAQEAGDDASALAAARRMQTPDAFSNDPIVGLESPEGFSERRRGDEAFGVDELDKLMTTYHWEETERRQADGALEPRGLTR